MTATYPARLRLLADFLDAHPAVANTVHALPDGPSFHLARRSDLDWRAELAAMVADLGVPVLEQTQDDVLVLRLWDTPLGVVTFYVPRFEKETRDAIPEVDLGELVAR